MLTTGSQEHADGNFNVYMLDFINANLHKLAFYLHSQGLHLCRSVAPVACFQVVNYLSAAFQGRIDVGLNCLHFLLHFHT